MYLIRLALSFTGIVIMLEVTADAALSLDDTAQVWPDYLSHPALAVRMPACTGYAIGGTCGFIVGFVVAPFNTAGQFTVKHNAGVGVFQTSSHSYFRGEYVPGLSLGAYLVAIIRWPVDGFVVGAEVAENGADLGQACAGGSFVTLKDWMWDTPKGWFTHGGNTRLADDAP